jgi:hypothetical protein
MFMCACMGARMCMCVHICARMRVHVHYHVHVPSGVQVPERVHVCARKCRFVWALLYVCEFASVRACACGRARMCLTGYRSAASMRAF